MRRQVKYFIIDFPFLWYFFLLTAGMIKIIQYYYLMYALNSVSSLIAHQANPMNKILVLRAHDISENKNKQFEKIWYKVILKFDGVKNDHKISIMRV